jgi:hypothetical protein
MIQTIKESQFIDAFLAMGRGNQFSYDALKLIYEYFEEVDPDYDLDVIAICCDFEELATEEIIRQYGIDCDDIEDDELDEHVLEYLQDHTSVVGQTDLGFVYQSF